MKRLPLIPLVLALVLPFGSAEAGLAKVIRTDGKTMTINAGVDRGGRVGMLAEIFRQTAPLIHPVTGENLGNPRVKIARLEITKVGAVTAEGRFVEYYAPVEAGDIVESIEMAPTSEDQIRASILETRAEMRELARGLASEINTNEKAITDLRATLRRIGSSEQRLKLIANDVRNVRERMVIIERRVVELEDNQQAMIMADTAEVKTLTPEDMTELRVLRRGEDEAIYLQVGSRTFRLSFERNALIPEIPGAGSDNLMEGYDPGSAEELMSLPEEEHTVPWYQTYWWVGALAGVVAALAIVLLRFLRRPSEQEPVEDEAAPGEEEEVGFAEDEVEVDEDFPEEIPEPEEVAEPK